MTGSLTYLLSIVGLIAYFSYVTVLHGTVGFLISVAIFLILSSFLDHVEYTTIGLLIIGLSLSIYVQKGGLKKEGFEDAALPTEEPKEEGEKAGPAPKEPTPASASASAPATTVAPSETKESTPASPTPTQAMDPTKIAKGLQDAMSQINSVKENTMKAAAQTSGASNAGSADGFQEPSAGLFKLGELPSEMKKGPFVDTASTLTKAMNALQPDQMAAMTAESQSLLETQKNLMGMLQSMKPVLQDGRQLLDTFSGIFGGLGGLTGGKVEGKA
jgi:hypothetical protein